MGVFTGEPQGGRIHFANRHLFHLLHVLHLGQDTPNPRWKMPWPRSP